MSNSVYYSLYLDKHWNVCSVPSTELGAGALETRNGTSLKKLVSGKVNIFVKGKKKNEEI